MAGVKLSRRIFVSLVQIFRTVAETRPVQRTAQGSVQAGVPVVRGNVRPRGSVDLRKFPAVTEQRGFLYYNKGILCNMRLITVGSVQYTFQRPKFINFYVFMYVLILSNQWFLWLACSSYSCCVVGEYTIIHSLNCEHA